MRGSRLLSVKLDLHEQIGQVNKQVNKRFLPVMHQMRLKLVNISHQNLIPINVYPPNKSADWIEKHLK